VPPRRGLVSFRAVSRDELVTRLLSELIKDRIEQRIFEFLGNDRRDQTGIGGGEAEPLEVAVMTSGNNARSSRSHRASEFIPAFEFNKLAPVGSVDPRIPEQIEHCACELLLRFSRDPFAFARKAIAEIPQIAKRTSPTLKIKPLRKRSGNFSEPDDESARQTRNQQSQQSQAVPLQPVTPILPARTHFRVVRQGALGHIFQVLNCLRSLT
jgi:hypothetical protein